MEVFWIAMGLFVSDHCPTLKLDTHMLRSAIEAESTVDPKAYKADPVKRALVVQQYKLFVTKKHTNCVQALAMFGPNGTDVQGIVSRK